MIDINNEISNLIGQNNTENTTYNMRNKFSDEDENDDYSHHVSKYLKQWIFASSYNQTINFEVF